MSGDSDLPGVSRQVAEGDSSALTEVTDASSCGPVLASPPAPAEDCQTSAEVLQTGAEAAMVTMDSEEPDEVLQMADVLTVAAADTADEDMDVTPQPDAAGDAESGGGGGAFCVPVAAAAASVVVPSPAGDSVIPGSNPSETEIPASVAGAASTADTSISEGQCPGPVPDPTRQSEQLPAKPVQTGSEPVQTGSEPDQSSSSRSSNSNDSPVESSQSEAPSAASTTDVTMATVNPAPPVSLPAGGGSSSSAGSREMAVSGALAMLSGYNSDGDGVSDGESAAEVGPELTVDREGLYRDSLAVPWSGDSESDSDSADDSPDSSSSSSDSESEPAAQIDDKEEDGETDKVRGVFGPMTKGELCLLDLPRIDHLHIALPEEQCTRVGVVTSVVDALVVVQSAPGSPALDIDSVLFLERGGRPLGRVYDVMGPVAEAAYCVRFNSPQEIDEFGIKPGADVYYAPGSAEYSHFVFVEALKKMRGSDASWWDSNEPPESCRDFSDDEQERSHKRQNRKRPMQGASESTEAAPEDGGERPRPAGRPERGRGRGQGRGQSRGGRGGGGPPCRPPWMPAPPRNPFYGHRGSSAGPRLQWQQPPPSAPPPGPFSRPPPPPGAFGQPPPPFPGRPPFGMPPNGGPPNQRPPGPPPNGGPPNQPPPWGRPAFWGGR